MIAVNYLYLTLAKRPTTFTGSLVIKPIGYNNTKTFFFFFLFFTIADISLYLALKNKGVAALGRWLPYRGKMHWGDLRVAAKAGLTVYVYIYNLLFRMCLLIYC